MRRLLKFRAQINFAASAVAALALAACSVMESTLTEYIPDAPAGVPANCHSSLGAYFLPKSFVKVEVRQYFQRSDRKLLHNSLTNLETVVRADTRRMFCLDYLASLLSSDQIQVKKTSFAQKSSTAPGTGSQLLETVASSAVDQSAVILRRLIRTAFIAIGGFRDVGFDSNDAIIFETVADFEYDPFDQHQSAYINDRLREFGFCLVLERYTFGQPGTSAPHYCGNPLGFMQRETAFGRTYAEFDVAAIAPRSPGILYRPRATFQLHVYVKNDPKGTDPWLLRKTMPVALENVSPVLSIGVDRAAFTKKQIALKFDRGVLTSVCIVKGSEVSEALNIPLEIVTNIAKLPTEMIQIQYDEITKSSALARAEQQLIMSQKSLIEVLNNTQNSPAQSVTGAAPKGPDKFEIAAVDDSLAGLTTLNLTDFQKFYGDCGKNTAAGK